MKNTLGLINYEGDCLKAIKEDGSIIIKDQYGFAVDTLSPEQLFAFVDGLINIVDSKGKSWNFTKESKDAKPSYSMIYNFVKDL